MWITPLYVQHNVCVCVSAAVLGTPCISNLSMSLKTKYAYLWFVVDEAEVREEEVSPEAILELKSQILWFQNANHFYCVFWYNKSGEFKTDIGIEDKVVNIGWEEFYLIRIKALRLKEMMIL